MSSVWFKIMHDFLLKKACNSWWCWGKKMEANRRNQRKKRNAGVSCTFNLIILLVFIFVTIEHQFSSWWTCTRWQEIHSSRPRRKCFSAKLGNVAGHIYNSITKIYLIIIIWIVIIVFIIIIFIRVVITVIWTVTVSRLTRSQATRRWRRSHASWRWRWTTRWKWRALKRGSAWWRRSPTRRRST